VYVSGTSARRADDSIKGAEVGDDGAVHLDEALRLLVAVMGTDHVMLGSDDPFPLGEEQSGRLVRGSVHLASDQKEAVLGHNAVRFFDL